MTVTVPTTKSRSVPTVGRRPLLAGATGAAALAGCAPAAAPVAIAPADLGALATVGGGTAVANAALETVRVTIEALETVRVTIEVNKTALIGQLHAYLCDPHFSINRHPVVDDWSSAKKLNLPRALLEALLLEGDLAPHDVEQFVDGLLSGYENMVLR